MRNSPASLALLAAVCLFTNALPADEARLSNLSTRAQVGAGANLIISGFVVGAGGGQTVLIRAVGPALGGFGLTGFLADPALALYRGDTVIATNDNWLPTDAATMTAVGAFPLAAGSRDAALVATNLAPGSYTAQVSGVGNATGLALVEVYEVGATAASSRLVNLSTRAQVGTGAMIMIPGLVVAPGTGTRRLLVRAAGPALATLGVTGTLADPVVTVINSAGVAVAANDNWGTPANAASASTDTLAAAFTSAGAFAFAAGSRDAAVLTDLAPGSYTVQVSGVGATSGVALVEVYDLTGIAVPATDPVVALDYVATAGNGDKIPHPLSTKTYPVVDAGRTVAVPENMVYVPAGTFAFGTGATAATHATEAYCIGKFEVTNAEWKTYLDAVGSKNYPTHWSGGTYPAGKAAHPVLSVSLTNAQAYCAWISQKTGWTVVVPTADQWEKAARGPSGFLYPWGNTLDVTYSAATGILSTKCNFNAVVAANYLYNFPNQVATYDNRNSPYFGRITTVSKIAGYDTAGNVTLFSISATGGVNGWVNHDTWTGFIYTDIFTALNDVGGTTTPVGSYTAGKGAYGCHDMAGNVWEWTTTTIVATNGAEAGQTVYSVRGGSWYATSNSVRVVDIGEGRAASGNFNTVGFRVALKLP